MSLEVLAFRMSSCAWAQLKSPGVIAHPGIAELGLLAQQAFFVVQVHLAKQKGSGPDVVLKNQDVAQQSTWNGFAVVQIEPWHVDRAVQEDFAAWSGSLRWKASSCAQSVMMPAGAGGFSQVAQRGAVLF